MKRDMDLIRDILLYIEREEIQGNYPEISADALKVEHEDSLVVAHYHMLERSGYVADGVSTSSSEGSGALTWAGHDFVDSIRDEEIWRKTKQAAEAAGGFSLRLLGRLATGFLEKKIADTTGVEISL